MAFKPWISPSKASTIITWWSSIFPPHVIPPRVFHTSLGAGPTVWVVLPMVPAFSSSPESLRSVPGICLIDHLSRILVDYKATVAMAHTIFTPWCNSVQFSYKSYVVSLLPTCCRLGCYDVFSELIQPPFSTLLPPEPLPVFKYTLEDDEFGIYTLCI